jgi:hypothetical protein
VADTARDEAGRVGEEAKAQTRNVVSETRVQLREQARQQTDKATTVLQGLGGNVRALAEGRTDETGAVGDYVNQVADRLEDLAQRANELGFDGVVDELQRLARRRPGAFLMGAAAAGFAVGRVLRGARDASAAPASRGTAGETYRYPRTREPLVVSPTGEPAMTGGVELDPLGPAVADEDVIYRVEER